MSPLPLLFFAMTILSPEPLVHEPPLTPFTEVNLSWDTHSDDFIPEALLPPPPPPEPEPPRPAKPPSAPGGTEQWRGLVSEFFPPEQVEMALCVIAGESGGNPGADNPRSTAAGLWQFLRSTWDEMVPRGVTGGSYASGAVYDPVASTRAAAWLWANLGWSQWNAASRC